MEAEVLSLANVILRVAEAIGRSAPYSDYAVAKIPREVDMDAALGRPIA